MQQVADWLKKLGMSEYAQRFAESDIDIDVLSELTDQDFDRLGVSLGHRRRMLRAIREWPALAERHAAPWSRKISAISSAGGDIGRRRLRRLQGLPAPRLLARLRQQVERARDAGDHAG